MYIFYETQSNAGICSKSYPQSWIIITPLSHYAIYVSYDNPSKLYLKIVNPSEIISTKKVYTRKFQDLTSPLIFLTFLIPILL